MPPVVNPEPLSSAVTPPEKIIFEPAVATAGKPAAADKPKTPEAVIETSPMGIGEPKVELPSPTPPPPSIPKEEEVPIVKIRPKTPTNTPPPPITNPSLNPPANLQVAPLTPPKKERSPASVALIVFLIILLTALINDVVIYYFFFLKK
jgi:hypothetical protein